MRSGLLAHAILACILALEASVGVTGGRDPALGSLGRRRWLLAPHVPRYRIKVQRPSSDSSGATQVDPLSGAPDAADADSVGYSATGHGGGSNGSSTGDSKAHASIANGTPASKGEFPYVAQVRVILPVPPPSPPTLPMSISHRPQCRSQQSPPWVLCKRPSLRAVSCRLSIRLAPPLSCAADVPGFRGRLVQLLWGHTDQADGCHDSRPCEWHRALCLV